MINIDFKLFNAMEIPSPPHDEASFILLCENRFDGVGDFDHLKTYIAMIREQIKNKNYKIKPIVAVHRFDPPRDEEEKQRNARADYVEKELVKMKTRGDIDDYVLLRSKDEISKKKNEIDAFLKNGIAFFGISMVGYLTEVIAQIAKNGHKLVKCPQLNTRLGWNRKNIDEVFDYAAMSLPRGDAYALGKDVCYGLPIMQLYDDREKINLIFNLNQDTEQGNLLLQAMLGQPDVTYSAVEQYFNDYAVMPGYPQTGVAAINFILIGILKNLDENNRLGKKLDFFLPKGIVDHAFLQEMLEKMAPDVKFEVITPDSKSTLEERINKVRIFSGFRLDDEHYSQLYSARNDIGLGSGDNTLLKVVSSNELPFFQDKIESIRNFNQYGIITLIEKMIDEQTQPELKENLQALRKYFKELASFVNGGPGFVGKFDVSNEGGINIFDFGPLRKAYEKYYDYIKAVADLAKNPDVQMAWKMVAQRIQDDFNYRDNFRGILNGVILMNNPDFKIKVENQKELNFDEFKEYVMTLNRNLPSTPATSRKKALVFRLSTQPALKIVTPPAIHETSKSKPNKPE